MRSCIPFIVALIGPIDGCYAHICRSVDKRSVMKGVVLFKPSYIICYLAFLNSWSSL